MAIGEKCTALMISRLQCSVDVEKSASISKNVTNDDKSPNERKESTKVLRKVVIIY